MRAFWLVPCVLLGCGGGGGSGSSDAATPDAALPRLVVSPETIELAEDGPPVPVSVTLDAPPAEAVEVDIGVTAFVRAAPLALVFDGSSFAAPQVIEVVADRDRAFGARQAELVLTSPFGQRRIPIRVRNSEVQPAVFTPAFAVSLGEAGYGGYPRSRTVTLSFAAEEDETLVLDLTSADPRSLAVAPSTLTIEPGHFTEPHSFTITAVDDDDGVDANIDVVLTASAPRRKYLYSVHIVDNDEWLSPNVMPSSFILREGDSGTLRINTGARVLTAMTFTFTSADPTRVRLTPGTVTFTSTSWPTPETVLVETLEDADTAENTVDFTISTPGLITYPVRVVVTDND